MPLGPAPGGGSRRAGVKDPLDGGVLVVVLGWPVAFTVGVGIPAEAALLERLPVVIGPAIGGKRDPFPRVTRRACPRFVCPWPSFLGVHRGVHGRLSAGAVLLN